MNKPMEITGARSFFSASETREGWRELHVSGVLLTVFGYLAMVMSK